MNEIGHQTGDAIRSQRLALAQKIVAKQYAQQAGFWEPQGAQGMEKSVRDAGYHLSYLAEAITASDPNLFMDYIAWVKVLFARLNFPENVLTITLQCTHDVLKESLPENFKDVACGFIETALLKLSELPVTIPSFISAEDPFFELTTGYLNRLLHADRQGASRLILEAVQSGISVKDVYLHVFQSTQREIGLLWQTNQLSVAQEHYCTAVTQSIMSQLYPHIFSTAKTGRRLLATCVGDELHEIGIRMVADFFEMEGWDTYYLGANVPSTSIVRMLETQKVDVLAISTTITLHLSFVADLIAQVRASQSGKGIKILVGGYPFNASPQLWQNVGADGFARDAQEAVLIVNHLINSVA